MPLSEEELRLLEQMERALVEEDPKLASTMRGSTLRASARRRALLAGVVFLAGIVVLMTGAVTKVTVVGIIGFVVMLVSAYVALSSWHGQNHPPEQPAARPSAAHPGFKVLDGGRRRKRPTRPKRSGPTGTGPRGSLMQRFEERWRRRRDQNGF